MNVISGNAMDLRTALAESDPRLASLAETVYDRAIQVADVSRKAGDVQRAMDTDAVTYGTEPQIPTVVRTLDGPVGGGGERRRTPVRGERVGRCGGGGAQSRTGRVADGLRRAALLRLRSEFAVPTLPTPVGTLGVPGVTLHADHLVEDAGFRLFETSHTRGVTCVSVKRCESKRPRPHIYRPNPGDV